MERIRELLENVSTMTLATTHPVGNPHAAPVYFVSVDFNQRLGLYFFSDEKSEHSQHIGQYPTAAAAIYPECAGWRDIKGLQLRGDVRSVDNPDEWESIWEWYQVKFPFVSALKSVVAQNQMYVFNPGWIRLVDNAQGFGFKEEWTLP